MSTPFFQHATASLALAFSVAVAVTASPVEAVAQAAAPAAKSAAKKPASPAATKKKAPAVAPKPPPEEAPPTATQAQIDAADRVYYGPYECEFKQVLDIAVNPKYPAYVDVRHGKALYVMTPVLSSTGAIRLEDTKGATLMVQIANKSMLLDTKAGRRIVDDCVGSRQRELIEAARQSKMAQAAAAASAAAASSPSAESPTSSLAAPADAPSPALGIAPARPAAPGR